MELISSAISNIIGKTKPSNRQRLFNLGHANHTMLLEWLHLLSFAQKFNMIKQNRT